MILEPQSIGEIVREMIARRSVLDSLGREWEKVRGTPAQWELLRRVYSYMTPLILSEHRISPYFLDWFPVFTPIEDYLWFSIRAIGLPFFPQYPVGRYFVDFADPKKWIAIECDGKMWHDAEKDTRRDEELAGLGWSVIRFTGRRCRMGEDHPDSAHAELEALAERYREEARQPMEDEELV